MQRPAKPSTPVRIRPRPPNLNLKMPIVSSPGGEIGRRKGLKIPRDYSRAGSSPASGTTAVNYAIV